MRASWEKSAEMALASPALNALVNSATKPRSVASSCSR